MKELIVISGKGGREKPVLYPPLPRCPRTRFFATPTSTRPIFTLIMAPDVKERHDFQSGHTAIIDSEKCTSCGICKDLCLFEAISDDFVVDKTACEGCGVCLIISAPRRQWIFH